MLTIKQKEKIAIVSFIVGLFSLGLAIYFGVFYVRNINVSFSIIEQSTVVDVKHDESKLSIYYDSVELKADTLELEFISLKVENIGRVNITENEYVKPLGFKIRGGYIAEKPSIIRISEDYIGNDLNFIIPYPDTIYFTDIALDSKAYFVVKLLVLHKKDSVIEIAPMGKISGVKEGGFLLNKIAYNENSLDGMLASVSWFRRIFNGGIGVQIQRTLIYGLAFLVFFFFLAFFNIRSSQKEEKFRNESRPENIEIRRLENLVSMDYSIDPGFLRDAFYLLSKYNNESITERYRNLINVPNEKLSTLESQNLELIEKLISKGYVIRSERDKLVNLSFYPGLSSVMLNAFS